MSTKKMIALASAVVALGLTQLTATAETKGTGTTPVKQVCKTFDIPTIICPAGQTLATPNNGCHGGTVQKTFCHDAARQGAIQPYAPGTRELVTMPATRQ